MEFSITESIDAQPKIGVVILAAGASLRMGRPKQLLLYRGQTLIRRAVETALTSACHPIMVVIGAHAELMKNELEHLPVWVAENREWHNGMSSSIRIGLEKLLAAGADLEGAVIMLCDQPFITTGVVNGLVDTHRKTGKNIVASEYREVRGVPVFFSRHLFAEITNLDANEGARQVIENHPDDIATVCFPEAAVDVDTPQDYRLLKVIRPEISAGETCRIVDPPQNERS